MEKGSVSLVKISPTLPVKEYIATVISPKLTHLCVITSEEYAHLFTILNKSGSEPSLKLTWTSTCKVKSCRFSQDDKKLLIISETRTLQIYSIQNTLELVAEEDSLLLTALLENTGVEVTEISDVRAVTFNKSFLTLLIDKKWLLNLFMQYPAPLSVKSVIGIPSCLTVASSKELIYCLTSGGNLSAYSIENGRQAGIVNLYSLLPYGSELQEVFPTVTVSANGALIAVSDESGKVYISSIEDYFSITNVQDESSRWDCGDSILTASSGTSYTSTRTVSSLLKIQPTSSV
ncbi:hypothetical protein C0J52_06500 [Blattella germanica]|nr:hypothetical protein C0J52_06500 [Blattella germanica]